MALELFRALRDGNPFWLLDTSFLRGPAIAPGFSFFGACSPFPNRIDVPVYTPMNLNCLCYIRSRFVLGFPESRFGLCVALGDQDGFKCR